MALFGKAVNSDTEHFDLNKKLDEDVGDNQVVVIKTLVVQVKNVTTRVLDLRAAPNNLDRRVLLLEDQTPGGAEFKGPGVEANDRWIVLRDILVPEGWRLHLDTSGAFPGEDSRLDCLYFLVATGAGLVGG